jgi:hypothetical protein
MFLKKQRFGKWICFRLRENNDGPYSVGSLRRRRRLALSKGPNRVGAVIILPEDGNRYSFRNIVFYLRNIGRSPNTRFFQINKSGSDKNRRKEGMNKDTNKDNRSLF